MKKVSVPGNYKLSHIQPLSCSPYVMSRFSPEEVRAVHFQPLMATRVRFLKNTLEAVIAGIEEMEKKTGEMPDNIKQKMGMGYDAEIDSDSPEDMRKFLIEVLGSTMRSSPPHTFPDQSSIYLVLFILAQRCGSGTGLLTPTWMFWTPVGLLRHRKHYRISRRRLRVLRRP